MSAGKTNGIVIGIVSDLEDPDNLARVRVKYPHLADQESQWARLATPMAGKERGFFCRPEVGDEVLVCFEQGDIRRPYILGSLWSSADMPPADDGNASDNNWRFIHSRSGHVVKLDDTDGSEKVEIIGKDEKHKIVIDVAGDKIQIICDSGDVEVTAKGDIAIEAENVKISARSSMDLKAPNGTMTIEGQLVKIN
ncbi:MAG: phage baseplate assembly protein V [Candidatus Promineifilaceae bacterium]|nr:phage baseplate assembly protein V [Candidatus Promineifilaceae bacterium]